MNVLTTLFSSLWRKGNENELPRPLDATGRMLVRELKVCPCCNSSFGNHSYALFATAVMGEETAPRLFAAIQEKLWSEARGFKEWKGARDNAEAYAIRCPGGRLAVIALISPFEFYYDDTLVSGECLNSEESRELETHIEDEEWELFF